MMFVLLFAIVAAQDTAPPALMLGSAYDAARVRNPRAQAALALASAAKARIAPAGTLPDPQLQLGFMNYALPALVPMEQIGMTQLQLMQMIPTAGKLGLSGRIAQAQYNAAATRATDVAWDVRARVAMAFYDLYATDRSLVVARQTLRLLQDILRTAESMYRVGEGRQTDVLRAQVEIARMSEDTLRMTTMRVAMAARLNALLDQPANVPVFSPALPLFPDSMVSLDVALAQAVIERPMLRAGEQDLAAAAAREKLARREIWPDLTVGLQYGQRGSAMGGGGTDRMGSLMLGASIPIFAAKRQFRMRSEMSAMRLMAEADLSAMRADTRAAVSETYANLVRSRNLATLFRTTIIPQSEAAVASALAAYRVGAVDFMTLLDNRMTVNKYSQELFALQAEQGKAWAELEMLLGRELFDPNAAANGTAPSREED